jgi:hypothetical protein
VGHGPFLWASALPFALPGKSFSHIHWALTLAFFRGLFLSLL